MNVNAVWLVRVVVEGAGLQPSGLHVFIDNTAGDELPADPIERVRALNDAGIKALEDYLTEAHDAEREHADEHGHVPAGLGFGIPEGVMIYASPLPLA